jgi:hypothetical protein
VLIDDFLPRYHVNEFHETVVDATPERTYQAIREVNFGRSPPIAALLAIRGLPHIFARKVPRSLELNLDFFLDSGFVILAESPPNELVLGVVGMFWRLDSGVLRIDPADFVGFDEPGFAKGVFNFTVHRNPGGSSRLTTETRVQATDESARRKFSRYWRIIGPFSGLIRVLMLRMIKRQAELVTSTTAA